MACRAAVTICVQVIADSSRHRSSLFLASISAQYQQCCQLSESRYRRLAVTPPKKPAGAFLKFLNEKSEEIISKRPDANQLERCRIAGQLWRDLDSEEKTRLKEMAREELQVYQQRYSSFLAQLSRQQKELLLQEKHHRRMTRAVRAHKLELQRLGRPKRPPNSFNLFVKASRLERVQAEPPDFLKELVKSWKQMSEEEKEVYRVKAGMEKEKYMRDMTRWEQQMRAMGRHDLIRKKSSQNRLASSLSPKTVAKKDSTTPP